MKTLVFIQKRGRGTSLISHAHYNISIKEKKKQKKAINELNKAENAKTIRTTNNIAQV